MGHVLSKFLYRYKFFFFFSFSYNRNDYTSNVGTPSPLSIVYVIVYFLSKYLTLYKGLLFLGRRDSVLSTHHPLDYIWYLGPFQRTFFQGNRLYISCLSSTTPLHYTGFPERFVVLVFRISGSRPFPLGV